MKYFDKKRVFDEYKKKLEEQGYQPLPAEGEDPKRWHNNDVIIIAVQVDVEFCPHEFFFQESIGLLEHFLPLRLWMDIV